MCLDANAKCDQEEVSSRKKGFSIASRKKNIIDNLPITAPISMFDKVNVSGDNMLCMFRSISNSINYILTGEKWGIESKIQTKMAKLLFNTAGKYFRKNIKNIADVDKLRYKIGMEDDGKGDKWIDSYPGGIDEMISIMYQFEYETYEKFKKDHIVSCMGAEFELYILSYLLDYQIIVYNDFSTILDGKTQTRYRPLVIGKHCDRPITILKLSTQAHYNVLYPKKRDQKFIKGLPVEGVAGAKPINFERLIESMTE